MSVDRDWERERHARRMALMNMSGELDRQERRWQIIGGIAVFVLVVTIILA